MVPLNAGEYQLIVTLKSGGKITMYYGNNCRKLFFDLDVLEQSFADNACDGYIGNKDVGTIVKCREIAAVEIVPILMTDIRKESEIERLKAIARQVYGDFDNSK